MIEGCSFVLGLAKLRLKRDETCGRSRGFVACCVEFTLGKLRGQERTLPREERPALARKYGP
jgi:hypothetical protein